MHFYTCFLAAVVSFTAVVHAAVTLDDVCTKAYAKAALPDAEYFGGAAITLIPSSLIATAHTNYNVSDQIFYPDAIFDYCNVTFAYSHTGRSDRVFVTYWLPTPAKFKNRYLSTGGGGYAITSGSMSLPGAIIYGAVGGTTDGGFGSFDTNFDAVFLVRNGTVNWESLFMFGYQAHSELSAIGKAFTKQFFNLSTTTKLYSYYQGCSEGGREGWSQVQRFGEEWDGAAIGAPAFRFSFQQVQHLYSNVVEKTLDYYPPPCELEKIVNQTIKACDTLDGKKDGVVSRTDLCKLNFDIDSVIGEPYHCAASSGGFGPPGKAKRQAPGGVSTPAQTGKVTAKGVAVAKEIIQGLRDTQGRQVYLSYQPAATFEDAMTQYNSETKAWELSIAGTGGEYITRFLQLRNVSNLENLSGVTYDTLRDWMVQGWQMYADTLQTDWPDLTPFHDAGGKIIHFHGESDNSIPTASSVRYYEAVRQIMYPTQTMNESTESLNDWYRLFLVPGAAHCASNPYQPNGPFPQTNFAVLIDWVENGVNPQTLNATVLQGKYKGENRKICSWPLRPLWKNGKDMTCVYDQKSIDTWMYDFNGVNLPVY